MIAATSIVLILIAGGSPALAQSAEAEGLFNDGNKLMSEGRIAQACDAFEASNRVEPRAGTLLRLGDCRERNQQLASAWSAYKDSLSRAKDPRKHDFATAKATALESRLSYLTVSVSEGHIEGLTLTRNGKSLDPMLWNRALPVDGGDYVIVGRAPGHEEWQTTAHVPVEGANVSVEVPKFKALSKLVSPPTSPSMIEHPDQEAVRSRGVFTVRRKISIGVAGAGVIGVVVGLVLGMTVKGKQSDAFKLCPDPATPCAQADQSNAFIKSSHTRALEANIAFGIAAAAATGAGVLWFTGAPEAKSAIHARVITSLVPGQATLIFVGRF
jgi:hypothetical protein